MATKRRIFVPNCLPNIWRPDLGMVVVNQSPENRICPPANGQSRCIVFCNLGISAELAKSQLQYSIPVTPKTSMAHHWRQFAQKLPSFEDP